MKKSRILEIGRIVAGLGLLVATSNCATVTLPNTPAIQAITQACGPLSHEDDGGPLYSWILHYDPENSTCDTAVNTYRYTAAVDICEANPGGQNCREEVVPPTRNIKEKSLFLSMFKY